MRKIPNYPNYRLTKDLEIYNLRLGRVMAPYKHKSRHGIYLRLGLTSNKVRTRWFIHELVALVYYGPKPRRMQVDHIDGNTLNNSPDNLEYVSARENARRAAQRRAA